MRKKFVLSALSVLMLVQNSALAEMPVVSACSSGYSHVNLLAITVMAFMVISYIYIMKLVFSLINSGGINLQEALSEEKEQPVAEGVQVPLVSSSSRIISFFGSLIMTIVFMAIGLYVIWGLFTCQDLKNLESTGSYFLAGSAIFAPYAFNKLSSIFKIK